MADTIRFELKKHITGIEKFPATASLNLQRDLANFGERAKRGLYSIMRHDTGEEKKDVTSTVLALDKSGTGFSFQLVIRSTVIQALVDETGAKPHFPPWKIGSKLYKWAERRGIGQDTSKGERRFLIGREGLSVGRRLGKGVAAEHNLLVRKQIERRTFLIARAQSRRGLPRPGDPLRKPYETASKHLAPLFPLVVDSSIARSIREANGVA